MTRSLALVIVALAGCDQVFDLQRPGPPPPTCNDDTTHDEDGDFVADPCDNCPGLANQLQEDLRETDAGELADGVGDACDPRPTLGGDYIERFHAFAEPSDLGDWEVLDGVWSVDGGQMIFDEQIADDERILRDLGDPLPASATIEARLTIRSLQALRTYIGIVASTEGMNGDGPSCSLFRPFETPDRPDGILLYHPNANVEAPFARMLTDGETFLLSLSVAPTTFRCAVTRGDEPTRVVAAPLTTPLPSGRIGLLAQRARVEFDYVVVYGVTAAAR